MELSSSANLQLEPCATVHRVAPIPQMAMSSRAESETIGTPWAVISAENRSKAGLYLLRSRKNCLEKKKVQERTVLCSIDCDVWSSHLP